MLKIPGVVDVEFDLDGFYDDLHQVIFLTKYDLHPERPDYWQARREMLQAIIRIEVDVYEPESGEVIQMQHPLSFDEHPEFDAAIGNEIYSWLSLWTEKENKT